MSRKCKSRIISEVCETADGLRHSGPCCKLIHLIEERGVMAVL